MPVRTYDKKEVDERIDEFCKDYSNVAINSGVMQDLKDKFE